MITIFAYNNFQAEKKYIFDFVFNEIFACDYKILFDEEMSYRIVENDKSLIIADNFFAKLSETEKYYTNKSLIPQNVEFVNYSDFQAGKIAVLFGNGNLKNENSEVFLENDLFAAIFFMLTRWEEIAVAKFDIHSRFLESENLSVKFDFFDRPIVNEHIQLIHSILLKLGFEISFKKGEYNLFLTHDIDEIAKYDSFFKIFKALGGEILKRKSFKFFLKTLKDVYKIKFKKQNDVYNTFDYLMDLAEKKGVKSRFYFIPGHLGEYDIKFDIRNKFIKNITDKIKARSHIIGIHPSYSSYCNFSQLKIELSRLQNFSETISEGRQHYLRHNIPQTWQNWEDSNLLIDSSIGFYDRIGFRVGICCEYPVFNVVSRKKLNLRERPLIVMDTALKRQCITKENAEYETLRLASLVKKYQGDFVLLWHNNNLRANEWEGWDKVYESILNQM